MKGKLIILLVFGICQLVYARPPKGYKNKSNVTYRADCQPGISVVDMDINNVRARLRSRGDMWWDYNSPAYEVPKGGGVSTIAAGGIWMGGYDENGNLKLAAATYESGDVTDYYPGPLNNMDGTTDIETCSLWDRKFVVFGAEIDSFRVAWKVAEQNGTYLMDDQVPDNIKAYPARGNPYYTNGFDLPDQCLAPFYDEDEDGIYNPIDGDFPIIGDRYGYDAPQYADEMVFQIFNDNGGFHTNTTSSALKMEIQLMSYAFNSEDFLKNTTFEDYKLIYRGSQPLYDTYFSFWIDGEIGCGEDDYVGVDTTRDLVYFYNASSVDGSCSSSYGANIPIQGVKLLSGPLDMGNEVGLTSFIYYNNSDSGFANATTDPESAIEYYNYMGGFWKDGSPMYSGGAGYQVPTFAVTKFAFPSAPNDIYGWSMAQEGLEGRDLRGVLSSGPITLAPGISNNLVYALPTVLDVKHPNPKIKDLLALDSLIEHFLLNFGCYLSNSSVSEVELMIAPNPASNYIRIQSTENIATVQLQLISMSGQVVLSQKATQNASISISHLPQGIYGYKVMDLKGQLLGAGKLSKN